VPLRINDLRFYRASIATQLLANMHHIPRAAALLHGIYLTKHRLSIGSENATTLLAYKQRASAREIINQYVKMASSKEVKREGEVT